MGIGKVRFLRLAVRKARGAGGVVQTEALEQLGIVVELGALPQLRAEKDAGGERLPGLRPRREAVNAEIGRAKARIALLDVGGLAVDLPVDWGWRRGGCKRALRRIPVVSELSAQADADGVE